MSFTITQEQLTRSLINKHVDGFYASFYNFPDNISNLLGRQVTSMERPSVTFNTFTTEYKGQRQINNAQLVYAPVNITFFDDAESLTTQVLYRQMFRQNGKVSQDLAENNVDSAILAQKTFDKAKFSIGVKVFGSGEKVVEQYIMKGCFIVGITHSQHVTKSTDDNQIICSISFDSVDYADIDAVNPFAAFAAPDIGA